MTGRYYETSLHTDEPPMQETGSAEPTGHAYITLTSGERVECRLIALSDTEWEAHPKRRITDLDSIRSAGSSCPAAVTVRFVL